MLWIRAAGSERRRLQGLIQLAAACVHLRKGRPAPAARLLALGIEKLEDVPADFPGIPAGALLARARSLLSEVARGNLPTDPGSVFSLPQLR